MRICDICKNEMTTNDCLMPGDNPTGIQDAWLDCTGIIVGWDNVQIRIRGKSKEGVIDGNRIMAMDVCPDCVPALLIRLLHNRIRPEDAEPAGVDDPGNRRREEALRVAEPAGSSPFAIERILCGVEAGWVCADCILPLEIGSKCPQCGASEPAGKRLKADRCQPSEDSHQREASIVKSEEREIKNPPGSEDAFWVVELEPGVWLATWSGDPGRTLSWHSASRFRSRGKAKAALSNAREYRPFARAALRNQNSEPPSPAEAGSPEPDASSPPLHESQPTNPAPAAEPEDVQSWKCAGCGAVNNQVFKDCGSCHRLKPIAEMDTLSAATSEVQKIADAWQSLEGRATYPA